MEEVLLDMTISRGEGEGKSPNISSTSFTRSRLPLPDVKRENTTFYERIKVDG